MRHGNVAEADAPAIVLRMAGSASREKQLTLLRELRDDYDHTVLSAEGVAAYAAAFGCPLQTHGIDLAQLEPPRLGETQGLASDELAEKLCRHFRVAYASKYGRGSQLRECCTQLMAHLSAKRPRDPGAIESERKRLHAALDAIDARMAPLREERWPLAEELRALDRELESVPYLARLKAGLGPVLYDAWVTQRPADPLTHLDVAFGGTKSHDLAELTFTFADSGDFIVILNEGDPAPPVRVHGFYNDGKDDWTVQEMWQDLLEDNHKNAKYAMAAVLMLAVGAARDKDLIEGDKVTDCVEKLFVAAAAPTK